MFTFWLLYQTNGDSEKKCGKKNEKKKRKRTNINERWDANLTFTKRGRGERGGRVFTRDDYDNVCFQNYRTNVKRIFAVL